MREGGEVGLFCTRKMNKKYPFSRKFKFENTRVFYEFLNQVPKTRPPPLILLFFSPRFNIFLVEKNQPKFYIYIYISFPSKFEISFRSLLLSKDNLATPCTHTHTHTHTRGSPSRRANRIAICARQQSLSRSCSSRSKGKRWKLAATNCSRWKVGGGNHGRLNPH